MQITPEQKQHLISLLQGWYPGWQNTQDATFVRQETSYKRKAAAEAQKLLAADALRALLDEGNTDEFIRRVRRVATSTNLLYTAAPSTSDIAVLEAPALDKPVFCRALFDLLHGEGLSHERLGRYATWVSERGLPNRWPFPTVLLFFVHPDADFQVKPSRIDWMTRFLDPTFQRPTAPTADAYARILEMGRAVIEAFAAEGASDMIDAHSIVWTCASVALERVVSVEKPKGPQPPQPQPSVLPNPDCPFTQRTFELLDGIHNNPTLQFYKANRDALHDEVEGPFQRVVRTVAERLPLPVKRAMETQRGIFAKFPKNDFGKGGTWDYYWSAFYPKGSKRSLDAQLSVWMNYEFLEYGFYIGDYGSEQRKRFGYNVQAHADAIRTTMESLIPDGAVFYGDRTDYLIGDPAPRYKDGVQRTWSDFVADPGKFDFDVSFVIPRDDLLAMDEETLVEKIRRGHESLYPLILLATQDDPMVAIESYLDLCPDPDDETPKLYTLDDFLTTTYLIEEDATELRDMLADRKQLLFYGPPGTGKTYVARELGKLLTGLAEPPPERVEIVQFHPAYGYEDFIEGIRPESKPGANGTHVVDYPTRAGVFLRFCQTARTIDGPCVFIIDEMNRGNIPRIFGELMILLEYRDQDVPLPYSGQRFSIPDNVYIIGTMNTADRSIALVDFALRRRFHFFHFGADPALYGRWLERTSIHIPYLLELYTRLCTEAIDDPAFAIGPSHFMRPGMSEDRLRQVWKRSIEPYLEEYHFDRREVVERWRWDGDTVAQIRAQRGSE